MVILYGVVFDASNGIAYGYALQLVGRALPSDRKAFGMALVTAAYAMDLVGFLFGLDYLVNQYSIVVAMQGLSILTVGIVASFLLYLSGIHYQPSRDTTGLKEVIHFRASMWIVLMLWGAYCAAVFAGLMTIGHATGIIQALGGNYRLGVWGQCL